MRTEPGIQTDVRMTVGVIVLFATCGRQDSRPIEHLLIPLRREAGWPKRRASFKKCKYCQETSGKCNRTDAVGSRSCIAAARELKNFDDEICPRPSTLSARLILNRAQLDFERGNCPAVIRVSRRACPSLLSPTYPCLGECQHRGGEFVPGEFARHRLAGQRLAIDRHG